MTKVRRNQKIKLFADGINRYSVTDENNNVIFKHNDNYFIYFKNVNFRSGGIIEGRYLGEASNNIVDDYCLPVKFSKAEGFTVNDKIVRTARMVAVDNKKKTLIIIES